MKYYILHPMRSILVAKNGLIGVATFSEVEVSDAIRSPNTSLIWIGGESSNRGFAWEGAEWDGAWVGTNQESSNDAILTTGIKDTNIVFGNVAS